MTEEQETQEQPRNDKEYNFRRQEAMYRKMLEEKEARIAEMEQKLTQPQNDDDDDDEPYVDHKKLNKKLAKFGEQTKRQTQSDIQQAVQDAIKEERKQAWLKNNSDFFEVMKHADRLASHDPELAETILQMPEGFERQKLAYRNIKALGLHQEKPKAPSIQEKVDANKRSPYYQPTTVGTAPYAAAGDFSPSGQKAAYDKLKELQARLRI